MDVSVGHGQFLVDRRDRNVDSVDVDGATPIESFADGLRVEIDLLMCNFRGMKQDAVLNDRTNFVARVGLSRWKQVKEVTVDRRHATRCGSAHGAGSLLTPVDGVMGQSNLNGVLGRTEGEDVDRR